MMMPVLLYLLIVVRIANRDDASVVMPAHLLEQKNLSISLTILIIAPEKLLDASQSSNQN